MPLFEYECRGCGQQFEYLTRAGQSPACPACKGAELQKRMSAFAVRAGAAVSSAPQASPCGACGDPRGAGSCSMN